MPTKTVLVVEDNDTNMMLATAILEMGGYEVDKATSAEAAEERLKVTLPDLILMDVGLPGVDGLEYTRQLKADPRTQNIPIMALTANAMVGDAGAALEAGCDAYMTKPLTVNGLLERVTALISSPREVG